MSLKKVEQIRADKPFKLADIFIYAGILTIVAVLLTVIFATRNGGDLNGVRILARNRVVFEYDFVSDRYTLYDYSSNGSGVENVEITEGDLLTIKIFIDSGFNVVQIDKSGRTAKVTEADCRTHDCVNTPPIKDNNGIIYCSPHRVQVVPFGFEEDDGTVII